MIDVLRRIRNAKEINQITSVYERHYEYPFAVKCITGLHLTTEARILDVGCSGSYLPLILAASGYRVMGSDLNRWSVQCKGFEMSVDDIKESHFNDAKFDVVTLISVIEHIGTPRYGEKGSLDAHLRAMKEVFRILKPSGWLIMTTPYGKSSINPKYHFRVHDKIDIAEMTRGFFVQKQLFIAPINDDNIFEFCTESQAMEICPTKKYIGRHATTMMLLKKGA